MTPSAQPPPSMDPPSPLTASAPPEASPQLDRFLSVVAHARLRPGRGISLSLREETIRHIVQPDRGGRAAGLPGYRRDGRLDQGAPSDPPEWKSRLAAYRRCRASRAPVPHGGGSGGPPDNRQRGGENHPRGPGWDRHPGHAHSRRALLHKGAAPAAGPRTIYGPYAYGLSGFSNQLTSFAGGDGVIGIHGTNAPWTVGQNLSHGCIRMLNRDIEKLVPLLPLGTPVRIVR